MAQLWNVPVHVWRVGVLPHLRLEDIQALVVGSARVREVLRPLAYLRLAFVSWLSIIFSPGPPDTLAIQFRLTRICRPERRDRRGLLRKLAAHGANELVRFVHLHAPFSTRDVVASKALGIASARGNLELAQWLVDSGAFELRQRLQHEQTYDLLVMACQRGHLELARYLAGAFSIPADRVRRNQNHLLRLICEHGHLRVAQWLVGEFALVGKAQVRPYRFQALRSACTRGHLGVARWLVAVFDLTAADVAASNGLRKARAGGHAAVEQWLLAAFPAAAEEAEGRPVLLPTVGQEANWQYTSP